MSAPYSSIPNVFRRDPDTHRMTLEWSDPVFGYLRTAPWEITEKLDGCFPPGEKVSMADGSRRKMSDVGVGDYVLGHDGERVVASRVLATHRNGSTDEWIKLRVANIGERDSARSTLVLTPDHLVYDPAEDCYVRADALEPGSDILRCGKVGARIGAFQRSVLIGKMLGDGSLGQQHIGASLTFAHKQEHVEYLEWTARALGSMVLPARRNHVSGHGTSMVYARTRWTADIAEELARFAQDGRKTVPSDLELDPVSLAFWYMDDGSLSHNAGQRDRAAIASNAYNLSEHETLVRALKRLGIDAVVQRHRAYLSLRMNADAADKFFVLIAPYVPPVMQYKLPAHYRGGPGWLPSSEDEWLSGSFATKVVSVERVGRKWEKHDLTTETSNFFVKDVLVHNCNIRIWRDAEGPHVAGRTDKAALQPELLEYCEQVAGRFDNEMTLYGEGVGPKIQKGGERYAPMQVFVVFDVLIGRYWLKREDVQDIAEELGILHAPYLGTMTLDGIVQRWLADPPVSVMHSDVPEGWVIRPAGGLLFRDGTPVRAKIKERDVKELRGESQ